MITDLELERVAAAIERALFRAGSGTDWTQVERLRIQSDLFDRLAAAQRNWTGSLSRRAELLRDSAERLADELNQVASALSHNAPPEQGERREHSIAYDGPPQPRRVTRVGTLPVPGEVVPSQSW